MQAICASVATLIDWENLDTRKGRKNKIDFAKINNYIETLGRKSVTLALAGFSDRNGSLVSVMHRFGIEPRFTNVKKIFEDRSKNTKTSFLKNAADIHLTVEALKIAINYPHISTFLLVTGDGGFVPLVRELKCLGKNVHVLARNNQCLSSDLKREVDSFSIYDELEECE
ncbi:MAG: NYN domain-containing protein [Candidatus Thermoplasmatota archaeon]|nr:NYN domain-containing protein [Candidatus Thermoplasmatota archaeon]MEC8609298.1 NYN domain-containing protein [Candidatus Thermoplasmatota archaeon]